MKPKQQPKKPQCEFWFIPNEKGLNITNAVSRQKFKEFLKKNNGQYVKAEFFEREKPKSEELLGFLFGGLYPLYILHQKHPEIKWKDEPFFVSDCFKEKLITTKEIEDTHATFMTEFLPQITFDLRTGKPLKQRGELSRLNQREAMIYVADVCDWFLENIGFLPDCEEYNRVKNQAKLIREEGLQAIDEKVAVYPDYQGEPNFE